MYVTFAKYIFLQRFNECKFNQQAKLVPRSTEYLIAMILYNIVCNTYYKIVILTHNTYISTICSRCWCLLPLTFDRSQLRIDYFQFKHSKYMSYTPHTLCTESNFLEPILHHSLRRQFSCCYTRTLLTIVWDNALQCNMQMQANLFRKVCNSHTALRIATMFIISTGNKILE